MESVQMGLLIMLLPMLLGLAGCDDSAPPVTAQPMSAEDFRRELVNVPLCGTPKTGPLAGKPMCTIHFGDGTATLAGDLKVARILWELQGNSVCRRDIREAADQRLCVTYERLSNGHYRNSDGVDSCVGPCPEGAR
jgi:hypothetical protein